MFYHLELNVSRHYEQQVPDTALATENYIMSGHNVCFLTRRCPQRRGSHFLYSEDETHVLYCTS